jgi:hypothetical protein
MDPIRNPYLAGAGVRPPELAGRDALLERARILLERTRAGRPSKSFIAVGLRGVGKTVLLNRIRETAEAIGYTSCFIEAHEQKSLADLLVPHLRRVILELDRLGPVSERARRALRVFRSFMNGIKLRYGEAELSLDIEPEAGAADSGDLEADLPELLLALGRAAKDRDRPIGLFLDEVQYLREVELSALIMGIHRTVQEGLPILLVAAGLPQVVGLSGRSKSYAERLFDFPPVGALAPADARHALQQPARQEGVAFDDAALEHILAVTEGYPFFLQEWGYAAWNAAPRSPISRSDAQAADAIALQRLDESFFRVRLDRLTPRERDYLRAMAELGSGPHRSGDIAEMLGVKVQSVGPMRAQLIGKGMIYSPAHGDTAFTVPLFDQFMRRTMPRFAPGRGFGGEA